MRCRRATRRARRLRALSQRSLRPVGLSSIPVVGVSDDRRILSFVGSVGFVRVIIQPLLGTATARTSPFAIRGRRPHGWGTLGLAPRPITAVIEVLVVAGTPSRPVAAIERQQGRVGR